MRTLLLCSALLGIFGTGCGGCVDDKGAPAKPAQGADGTRKVTHVRLAFDASTTPLGDPPASGGDN